jgi:hypothetical protein
LPVFLRSVRRFTAVLLAASGWGCGGVSTGKTTTPATTVPVVSHVFLLIDENHSYTDVIGNSAMPYTNSLAQQYSLATQYYANAHPSLPNYFMLTTGTVVTNTDDFTGTVSADNVVRALTAAGKTWKIYAESLPNIGYLGPTVTPYDKEHDPFSYITDVLNSPSQAANVVPFTQLATDLQNGALPGYAMIVPNIVDDAHDCPNQAPQCADSQKLAAADSWIQANIAPLINSPQFGDSVLIYTWDESEIPDTTNGGGHVATILVGSKVKRGYQSTTLYQHQSTLRLTMELLGVSDLPGAAAAAPDMGEFF